MNFFSTGIHINKIKGWENFSLWQKLKYFTCILLLFIPGKASANGSVPKAEKGKPVKNEDHASASGGDNLAKEFLLLSNQVTFKTL